VTPDELADLVRRGESETLEFKKTTGEREAGLRTLCGMLNGAGGRVLFGVTPAGKVIGQDVSDATQTEMAHGVTHFDPFAPIQQEWIELPSGKTVLVVSADASPEAPHDYQGRPYRRVNSTTTIMPQADYVQRLLVRTHKANRWENRTAEGNLELDMGEVRRMLTDAVVASLLDTQTTDPADALDRLGLVVGGRATQAAVVAFAVNPYPAYPQCALRLARFRGVTKDEFLDQNQMTGHAFKLLREADLFLRRHLPVTGRFESGVLERIDEPLFPPLALREALVNALIHRDYSLAGGAVSVAVFDDRVEISSAGTLPSGITVEDLTRDHQSLPRNPLLAETFFRRGLIEKWGRGTQKIVRLCVEAGHPSPEFVEQGGGVTVRFIPKGYAPPHRIEHNLTERQRRILFSLRDGGPVKPETIRLSIDPELPKRTLRHDLKLLSDWGLIKSTGRANATRWSLV
jgi:ATP-dependent DNA helicase RecG